VTAQAEKGDRRRAKRSKRKKNGAKMMKSKEVVVVSPSGLCARCRVTLQAEQ
jgi:hypothetical protein